MTRPILQLSVDELWTALDGIDPIEVVTEELIGKTVDRARWASRQVGAVTPWQDPSGALTTEFVLVEELRTGARCLLPDSTLRMVRAAALSALAARELATHGVVTAAVLGSGPAAELQLTMSARYVPGISHLAVWQVPDGRRSAIAPRVLDQLELAGIGLSFSASVAEAVFGANLIISVCDRLESLEIGQLARGALVVNATAQDLPNDLVDGVDQVYVDDIELVGANSERYFVKASHRRQVAADLGQVLTRAHLGRRHIDDILLVELLSANVLDVPLARGLCRSARESGLGTQLLE
jgi:ornithine cyclodeaminase/alanine dehydrogenase-like protein (mu-crystallin family)